MRKILLAVFALLIVSSCATYHDRYGRGGVYVEPEFWGTVTYIDPGSARIDLDYVGDAGRHFQRSVYYDPQVTRWDGVRYNEIRNGDRIYVRGRDRNGRYQVESVRRYQ